jgi:hypothetical protein
MKRLTRWMATGVLLLASVVGFTAAASASPPVRETGSGRIGLSHFHENGTSRVEIKSTENWLIVEARQDLVAFHGGPLGYGDGLAQAIGEAAPLGGGTGTKKRDLREGHDSFAGSIFVPRQPWFMSACGYGDTARPNLEFVIEGGTKSLSSEPITGTIRSTKNSDVQFKGTFVSRGGFGFGSVLDYTVTVECP